MNTLALIVGAIVTLIYVITKIRHHKLSTSDAIFWFFFSLLLFVLAIFPQISVVLSDLVGVYSPVNFVYLLVIALLVYHQLSLSVHIAHMKQQIAELSQHTALFEKEMDDVHTQNSAQHTERP